MIIICELNFVRFRSEALETSSQWPDLLGALWLKRLPGALQSGASILMSKNDE